MPIIARVGRKSLRVRSIVFGIYAALLIGALTACYPYWLMIVTGMTTEADYSEWRPLPRYFHSDTSLFHSFLSEYVGPGSRCDGSFTMPIEEAERRFQPGARLWQDIQIPSLAPPTAQMQRLYADWVEFVENLPRYCFDVGYKGPRAVPGPSVRRFRDLLRDHYASDASILDAAFASQSGTFDTHWPLLEHLMRASYFPQNLLRHVDYYMLKGELPFEERQPVYTAGDFGRHLFYINGLAIFDRIGGINEKYGLSAGSFTDIHLPAVRPEHPELAGAWEGFVRGQWPARFVRLRGGRAEYAAFLRKLYADVGAVNAAYGTAFSSFDAPDLFPTEYPEFMPASYAEAGIPDVLASKEAAFDAAATVEAALAGPRRRAVEWSRFVAESCPIEYIELCAPEHEWPRFLRGRYADLESLNEAHGSSYSSWADVRPPLREAAWTYFHAHRGQLRRHYATRNFGRVLSYVSVKGRALFNTVVLVTLTIATHLTISPICAYVLSRFRLRYTYKVLLFLVATMAFPATVGSIPSFLMLKKMGLFNTYAALVLPGLANGFGIFILKCFFDGLPQELFEAAIIEGASEMRMCWHVAVPLIRPILAVNVLGSFTAAYGSFMWAFLVCREERMWTLMVYLFQLQAQSKHVPLVMAALFIASVPTLLVFVFCQKIIMRGVILPSFK